MKPTDITYTNYTDEIKNSQKPVLMIFSASWCPTCRMQAPVMNRLATDIDDVKIAAVNIDNEKQLVKEFEITAIPTIVYINDEEITKLEPGYKKKEELLTLIGH